MNHCPLSHKMTKVALCVLDFRYLSGDSIARFKIKLHNAFYVTYYGGTFFLLLS
jgi:hypothetical protein